jgi:hypothetical protein
LRRAPELAWQTIDGEGVVVDLPRRRLLGLNPTGSFIWDRIDSASEEEISAELARAFDVEEGQARSDVRAFIARLRDRGFLVAP